MTYLPLRRMVRKCLMNEKIRLRSLPRSCARTVQRVHTSHLSVHKPIFNSGPARGLVTHLFCV